MATAARWAAPEMVFVRSPRSPKRHAALDLADGRGLATVAAPLLGAGARGAPPDQAASAAADAVMTWRRRGGGAGGAEEGGGGGGGGGGGDGGDDAADGGGLSRGLHVLRMAAQEAEVVAAWGEALAAAAARSGGAFAEVEGTAADDAARRRRWATNGRVL